ncbi:hypothetical protein ACTFIW_011769 [Dictyostelium discoideum]
MNSLILKLSKNGAIQTYRKNNIIKLFRAYSTTINSQNNNTKNIINNNNNNNINNNNNNNKNNISNNNNKNMVINNNNNRDFQKSILLMNIKELFKNNIKLAVELLSKYFKQNKFNDQDVEILFQWSLNNRYFTNIDLMNLFLKKFIEVNNLLNIQKVLQACQNSNTKMNLETYIILIRYFTVSEMIPNLKSIINSLNRNEAITEEIAKLYINSLEYNENLSSPSESSTSSVSSSVSSSSSSSSSPSSESSTSSVLVPKPHVLIYYDLFSAYLSLGEISTAEYYFDLIKPHSDAFFKLMKYYQSSPDGVDYSSKVYKLANSELQYLSKDLFKSGPFLRILSNLPFEKVQKLLKNLYTDQIIYEDLVASILLLYLENNPQLVINVLENFSKIITKPNFYISLIKQLVLNNDIQGIIRVLTEIGEKGHGLNSCHYQYILQCYFEGIENNNKVNNNKNHNEDLYFGNENEIENLSKILNHIVNLDPSQGNIMATLLFYNQSFGSANQFQALMNIFEKQPTKYIDEVTSQVIRSFIQLDNFDLAMLWYITRFEKYGLGLNKSIILSFLNNTNDEMVYSHYKKQHRYYPTKFTIKPTQNESNEITANQMKSIIDQFLKEQEIFKQQHFIKDNNNKLSQKKSTTTTILEEEQQQQLQVPLEILEINNNNNNNNNNKNDNNNNQIIKQITKNVYESNKISTINETNLHLQSLLNMKLKEIENEKNGIGFEFKKKTFNINKSNLSEEEESLTFAISEGNKEKIFSMLKNYLNNNILPQSKLLISSYYKLWELDVGLYSELIEMSPPFIRILVFNCQFYNDLLNSNPDEAFRLLKQESPLSIPNTLYNTMLEIFIRAKRMDIFVPFCNLMLSTNIDIDPTNLSRISKSLIHENSKIGNIGLVVKIYNHFENMLKLIKKQMIKEYETNNDIDNDNDNNNNNNDIEDFNFTEDDYENYTQEYYMQFSKRYGAMISQTTAILMNEVADLGPEMLSEVIIRLNDNLVRRDLDNYSYSAIASIMRAVSLSFPLEKGSPVKLWTSYERHFPNRYKTIFYEQLFYRLHLSNKSYVVNSIVRKNENIRKYVNQRLFQAYIDYGHNHNNMELTVSLYSTVFRNLQELNKTPYKIEKRYHTLLITSFEWVMNQCTQTTHKTSQLRSLDEHKNNFAFYETILKHLKEGILVADDYVHNKDLSLSDETINLIPHFVSSILSQHQKLNPSFDPTSIKVPKPIDSKDLESFMFDFISKKSKNK